MAIGEEAHKPQQFNEYNVKNTTLLPPKRKEEYTTRQNTHSEYRVRKTSHKASVSG